MLKVYTLDTALLNDVYKYEKYYNLTSQYRREKIDSFKFTSGRQLALGASILLDKALSVYGYREKDMEYALGEKGKPSFSNEANFEFSISHSNRNVVLAVSDSPVGIDIERIKPLDDTDLALVKKHFTSEECKTVMNAEDPAKAFYMIWTLKESFLKATGKGLSLPLNSFTVRLDPPSLEATSIENIDSYMVIGISTFEGYCTSLCWLGENRKVEELELVNVEI